MKLTNLFCVAVFIILIIGCSKDSNNENIIEEPVLIEYFIDNDKDGYGNPDKTLSILAKTKPNGYVGNDLDCDDNDENINPLADDYAFDGLDFNCDGKEESIVPTFSKTYGGSDLDRANAVIETNDGGYLVLASTASHDGDIAVNKGERDLWLFKINQEGDIEWEKTYGGTGNDGAGLLIETISGEFLILGGTGSTDIDISSNNGLTDYWILKIDDSGNILWQETYGGSLIESPQSLIETQDGHFALLGTSQSPDGDVTGNKGQEDLWFARINANGTLVSSVTFGGSNIDMAAGMIEDQNGNFIITATTASLDGDLEGIKQHTNTSNWILKIDKEGVIISNKIYGGESSDSAIDIINTSDGGYLVGGLSFSTNNGLTSNGSGDIWLMKFNSDDEMLWQTNFGGSRNDYVRSLLELDDGYLILCNVFSSDGDIENNYGELEPILFNLDQNGNIRWQKNYGGSSHDSAVDIIQTMDKGYFMVGETGSSNYDIMENKGRTDAWLLKLDPEFNLNPYR